jgi:hypothetical protein
LNASEITNLIGPGLVARLNWSWELEAQPYRTITESRAQPGDSSEVQETEKQFRGAFVISKIRCNGTCETYLYESRKVRLIIGDEE